MRRGKSYEIFTDLNQMLTKNLRICTTVSVPILKSESCANTISICWSTSVNLRLVSSKDDLRLHFSELVRLILDISRGYKVALRLHFLSEYMR